VPLARTRAERFDDLVLDAVERLERRWSRELDGVEFGVEDVPPAGVPGGPMGEPVPLGRVLRAGAHPPRIVIYRRPVEARALDLQELSALVHDVVVEQVADLLGMEPEAVDPRYDY
jgi:predicted Zn-dependent protease with MMP-like domain